MPLLADAADGHPSVGACDEGCCAAASPATVWERDAGWLRAARWARRLAWVSLVWMCIEGGVGLWQGVTSGSISLIGWSLGSAVEGVTSVIVVWRFTGTRTLSETSERRAQPGVAVSFWLIAPYIAAQSAADLLTGHRAEGTLIGIVLTAVALLEMPLLGYSKHKLGAPLGSGATTGRRHPELPVRGSSRRSPARPRDHRPLARRLVARPRPRFGHRRGRGSMRASRPGAARTAAADHHSSGDSNSAIRDPCSHNLPGQYS